MTYDELVDSILTAKEEMLKHKIEANSVTLNGRKYGKLFENCPPNMKPTIFGMAVKTDCALPDDYDFLVQYEPPQPMSNADRIRAMTDEELAKFMGSVDYDPWQRCDQCKWESCEECCLEWLREETKDEQGSN